MSNSAPTPEQWKQLLVDFGVETTGRILPDGTVVTVARIGDRVAFCMADNEDEAQERNGAAIVRMLQEIHSRPR